MSEKEEKFLPGRESEEQFDSVVSLLGGWIEAGIVKVDVDLDGDIAFELPEEMDTLLGAQIPDGLDYDKVGRIVSVEIATLIGARLARDPRQYLRMRMPEEMRPDMDKMLERAEKAATALVEENVRERVLLRRAATGYGVESVKRGFGTYHVEVEENKTVDVPHVWIEMNFCKPHSGRTLLIHPDMGTMRLGRTDEVTVNLVLHNDDVKDLIRRLTDIVDEMGARKPGEHNGRSPK